MTFKYETIYEPLNDLSMLVYTKQKLSFAIFLNKVSLSN